MEPVVTESPLLSRIARAGFGSDVRWAAGADQGHDLEAADGTAIVEIKERVRGRRDLAAAVAQLALHCSQSPNVEHAYLVLAMPTLSAETTKEQWAAFGGVLRPEVAERIHLVAVWPDEELLIPDNERTRTLAQAVRATSASTGKPPPRFDGSSEVLKLLLRRFLLGEPSIRISELQAQAGRSYPTVSRDLRLLGKHVQRESDRSVRLGSFPTDAWAALRAQASRIRDPQAYADATGRAPNLDRLLSRLRIAAPSHVAVGGVVGARFWKPDIDIDGTPRIDLCVHAPTGRRDVAFLKQMDVALTFTDEPGKAIVVVHSLYRPVPHFTKDPHGLPIADPVEVLLDLNELRLDAQATELRRHLRRSQ